SEDCAYAYADSFCFGRSKEVHRTIRVTLQMRLARIRTRFQRFDSRKDVELEMVYILLKAQIWS
ncbi:MAG: hypothetical protein WBZ42_10750, partial [Halobacteriota archaeon]